MRNKEDFIKEVAASTGMGKVVVAIVMDGFLTAMAKAIENKEEFGFRGFGRFVPTEKAVKSPYSEKDIVMAPYVRFKLALSVRKKLRHE